mgnify:FL=1
MQGCIDCGYKEHQAALDFDHINDNKLFNIMCDGLTRPWLTLIAEVVKCEVVCANCHRIRSYRRLHGLNDD